MVVIKRLKLLRMKKCSAKFIVNDSEALREIVSSGNGAAFRDAGFKDRVKAKVGKERSGFGGRVFEVVEGEFS